MGNLGDLYGFLQGWNKLGNKVGKDNLGFRKSGEEENYLEIVF